WQLIGVGAGAPRSGVSFLRRPSALPTERVTVFKILPREGVPCTGWLLIEITGADIVPVTRTGSTNSTAALDLDAPLSRMAIVSPFKLIVPIPRPTDTAVSISMGLVVNTPFFAV